jgi:hypothetical protein
MKLHYRMVWPNEGRECSEDWNAEQQKKKSFSFWVLFFDGKWSGMEGGTTDWSSPAGLKGTTEERPLDCFYISNKINSWKESNKSMSRIGIRSWRLIKMHSVHIVQKWKILSLETKKIKKSRSRIFCFIFYLPL